MYLTSDQARGYASWISDWVFGMTSLSNGAPCSLSIEIGGTTSEQRGVRGEESRYPSNQEEDVSEEDADERQLREMREKLERYLDQSRGATFENEKFAISVLQAVSGGSLVAAFAQIKPLTDLASVSAVYVFITLASFSLVLAVLAAYFKHQYKMWDLKMHVVQNALKEAEEAIRRQKKSQTYLKRMRWAMGLCVTSISTSFAVLCIALWWRYLGCGR